MSHMYILRGGPGSGKTTYVDQLKTFSDTPPVVCSADDFFVNEKGEYKFDPAWLGRAHGACFRKAIEAVIARQDVVIDNTNGSPDTMSPYLALCQAYGYTCEVIKIHCDREVAWARQTHGCPRDIFDGIFDVIERTEVPGVYRDVPWLTQKDVGLVQRITDTSNRLYTKYNRRPNAIADCARCGFHIAFWNTIRLTVHEKDTCECDDGEEEPTNLRPICNCGVSLGIRSDHEGECAAAYLRRAR